MRVAGSEDDLGLRTDGERKKLNTTTRLVRALAAAPLLALACWCGHAAGAAPSTLPVEQFFQNPAFYGAALSPNGRSLAINVASKGGHSRLAVVDLQTMKPTVVASFDDAGVGQFRWVNDHRLVFDIATEREAQGDVKMNRGLFAVNADGVDFRQLAETLGTNWKNPVDAGRVLPWNTFLLNSVGLQASDDVFVVVPEEISAKKYDYVQLKRLNTKTGKAVEVESPLHSFGWIFDKDGALRLVVTKKDDMVAIRYRDADGAWRKLSEYRALAEQRLEPRFIGPDGVLYVESTGGSDKVAVYTYDPVANKLSAEPVVASKDYDLHPTFIANDKKLLGLRYLADAEVTQWLDPDMKAVQGAVDAMLPKTSNRLSVAPRSDSAFILVEAFADVQPTLYYLYNNETKKLMRVGAEQPEINPAQMSPMDMVRYKARDGLEIPAYLTLPRGAGKKNLPTVVLVHGGPWVRGGSWHWDPQVQFLASRGYAVLQPEFRGSTGFGTRHFRAGWKQWGLAMQSDIADGARWAIAQGIADPKRICIAGASYGGYATLMGLINDPDLFRCGVEWVGVTDIGLLYSVNWSDTSDESKRYGLPALVGDRDKDAAQFKATSPLENAARIKQPLLMAYGDVDERVPLVHGQKMRDALKDSNPQLEWVVYPNEGHGWVKPETKVDFWTRVERFLERNIGTP